MGGLFSTPSMPAPPPAPVKPERTAEEVRAAQLEDRRRRASATGRGSTILTTGKDTSSVDVKRKELLGA